MRATCNKKEDNFITYHQNRKKEIERVRDWEKLNPEKRKEYTIKYYKTEKGHRKRLAQQKRYREKKKLIKENEKLKNDKMELLKMVDNLEKQKKELRSWLEEMLDNENDIFSVVRVKDVLSKLNELEGEQNENRSKNNG